MYRYLVQLILLVLLSTSFQNEAMAYQKKKNRKKKKVTVVKTTQVNDPWMVDTLIAPIPINRQLFTDKIYKLSKKGDLKDGVEDQFIHLKGIDSLEIISYSLIQQPKIILAQIENNVQDHGQKIKYYRNLEQLLTEFNRKSLINTPAYYFKRRMDNFQQLIIARELNKVKEFVENNEDIYTLQNVDFLEGFPNEQAHIYRKVGIQDPKALISKIPKIINEPYIDDIIAALAKTDPGTVLNFATSTSHLNSVVRNNKDSYVQAIVKIASESRNPLKALPFIDDVFNKKKSLAAIDAYSKTNESYFKELVKMLMREKVMAKSVIEEEMNYRALYYVRLINELHERPGAVRFKSLETFNAPELYFIMLGGRDEIYTSSFTGGTFKQMMDKLGKTKGDQLLADVNYYQFRTFIRMCAGYNTLSDFFKTFEEGKVNELMQSFVANLEQGNDMDLTDAVDVADAYGSLKDPVLIEFLKGEVTKNLNRVKGNVKGERVYTLLDIIFNNAENTDDLATELNNIPPITYMPIQQLKNNREEIIIQTYFYGDDDGKMSFESFKSNFPAAKWTAERNKNWISYTFKSNKKIKVFANLPLTEPQDEKAIEALVAYFGEKEIEPSIVIHRGHSYHLPNSLKNLNEQVKIVMLGSCGGYHNLANVLDKSPDANIISSKQIGAMSINEPIIKAILNDITSGNNVDWIKEWKSLETYFNKRPKSEQELFSDYIPPHKNLGAIFIKAYRNLMVS